MIKKLAVALTFTFLISAVAYNPIDAFQKKAEREKTDDFINGDCQKQFENSFTNYAARQVAEERQTLPRAAVQVLDVEGSRNGGVSIRGWDQPDILIRACKLASADDDATAQAILKQLTISTEGGKVRASQPEGSDRRSSWTVQFHIFVPRDLAIQASVHNGGLSLTNLVGKVTGRSQNGGISLTNSGSTLEQIELFSTNGGVSLRDVEGKVSAHSTNGGINLVRGSGEVKLDSQNGGINVRLPEGGWMGELLEARSQNGGLILQVPEGFNSGIEAETSSNSRLDCRLPQCPQIRNESEREPKRVQLGGSSPLVHVSTRNGSLQITSAK
jgi:DUF4097 and DUF4098 domain-containing protein YvlB